MQTEFQDGSTGLPPVRPRPRPRWLVVDDDEGVLGFLAALLETLGLAEVQRFNHPAAALAALAAAPDRCQLVITDLEMPGMNGIELCRRMRRVVPQLKIVLATGSCAVNEAGARCCGFIGLLNKPFPAADLWRTLSAAGVLTPPVIHSNH